MGSGRSEEARAGERAMQRPAARQPGECALTATASPMPLAAPVMSAAGLSIVSEAAAETSCYALYHRRSAATLDRLSSYGPSRAPLEGNQKLGWNHLMRTQSHQDRFAAAGTPPQPQTSVGRASRGGSARLGSVMHGRRHRVPRCMVHGHSRYGRVPCKPPSRAGSKGQPRRGRAKGRPR